MPGMQPSSAQWQHSRRRAHLACSGIRSNRSVGGRMIREDALAPNFPSRRPLPSSNDVLVLLTYLANSLANHLNDPHIT